MQIVNFSFVVILMLALPIDGVARAEVIISEIMYNPRREDQQPGGFNREWVEVYNSGTAAVDLSGWVFEDIQDITAAAPIPDGTILDPGQALVLLGDADTFDAEWGAGINRVELANFPDLADSPSSTDEILALIDDSGVTRDVVNYDDENGWPRSRPPGTSIYVLPGLLNSAINDIGTNWGGSTPDVHGASYSVGAPFGDRSSPGIVVSEAVSFPPFAPSPDAAWSMVVFPDTQNYVKYNVDQDLFVDMAEWVRDHRDTWNIQVVLHEGDIVGRNSLENPFDGENPATLQWQNAEAAMGILNGEVPYIMATGNHDYGIFDADENRSTRFNDFFQSSDNPLVDPVQGGILKGVMEAGKLENAYYEFTAPDGREMVIFSLEWGPRQQVVDWANQVVSQSTFDDHTAVLLTHAYMYQDDTRYDVNRNLDGDPDNDQEATPHAYPTAGDTHDGEELWNELISQHGNFELVFSGHTPGDGVGYLASTGDQGNLVHQMLFNTQSEPNGGNGWIRLLEFLDDGRTVRVRTYSPTFGYIRDDPANDFLLTLSITEPTSVADFNGDGEADGDDVDALVREIVMGSNDSAFDLSADGAVNNADLSRWLSDAAAANGFNAPYLLGDANLDGMVDVADLNALGQNWLSHPNTWQLGDFNADGTVNAGDLNKIGQNWLASIPLAATAESVPEPTAALLSLGGMCFFGLRRRDKWRRHTRSGMMSLCVESIRRLVGKLNH